MKVILVFVIMAISATIAITFIAMDIQDRRLDIDITTEHRVPYTKFYVEDEVHYVYDIPDRDAWCVLSYGDNMVCFKK